MFRARPALDADGNWNPSGGSNGSGYRLPSGWQHTKPDPAVLDRWQPGEALAAVMGHAVDVLDVDSHKGGDSSKLDLQMEDAWPTVLGIQRTPSGGTHDIINPLRAGSRDGFAKGVDHKGGKDDGSSRGFIWIAPTLKLSKVTGEVAAYRWEQPPALDQLDPADASGAAIAEMIHAARQPANPERKQDPAEAYDAMTPERRVTVDRYIASAVAGVTDELEFSASMGPEARDFRGRGWEKIQADAAMRLGSLARADWNGYTVADALADFEEAAPTDGGWTSADVREKFNAQVHRGAPAAMPVLTGGAVSNDPVDGLEAKVREALERLQVNEEARRRFNEQNRNTPEMPEAVSLADLLAANLDAPRWRIERMWPANARVNLVASAKAGKTTMTANLVGSLADGGDFLGHHVTPLQPGEWVTIFDTEMTELQLQDWYRDLGLQNADRVRLVPIMGRATGLNFLEDEPLQQLVGRYAGAHTYILDPVGPVLSGLGLDENSNTDVQRFLSAWDTFVTLMGGKESVIVHHAGHSAERARGASAFLGSGSAIWTLTSDDPNDPNTQRNFRAMGRDVNIPVTPLRYDPFTRRLSLASISRAQHQKEEKFSRLSEAVLEVVAGKPGVTAGEIEKYLRANRVPFRNGEGGGVAKQACERGLLRMQQDGPAKRFFLVVADQG